MNGMLGESFCFVAMLLAGLALAFIVINSALDAVDAWRRASEEERQP